MESRDWGSEAHWLPCLVVDAGRGWDLRQHPHVAFLCGLSARESVWAFFTARQPPGSQTAPVAAEDFPSENSVQPVKQKLHRSF